MGNSAVRACPASGSELQHELAKLERGLFTKLTVPLVKETETRVDAQLRQWDGKTAEYFQSKATEAKELLIVLTRTAESMGRRDHCYASHFGEMRVQLQAIADLEDLTQVRASLVRQAAELETYIETMEHESQTSIAQLQAEVTTYETKLKAVEQLAMQDALTGISNRRSIEERIEGRIAGSKVFCIVILDLNGFKQVNDTYGHLAGDDLLRQFSQELRTNIRGTDHVGRWGGDEFIVVLDGDMEVAKVQVERLQQWVLGEYSLKLTNGTKAMKVKVAASIGVAQWRSGEKMPQLIARADSAMYCEKKKAHGTGA
jgi:diguanylate cyclase (GGDEF)-like protein